MADEPLITKVDCAPAGQLDVDRELLHDEDLLDEERLRRIDQCCCAATSTMPRMFSRLSLDYSSTSIFTRRRRTSSGAGSRSTWSWSGMIEREMARRHTY